MTRVLLFGTFDVLHEGHLDLFRQAKELGDSLLVVVARDSAVREKKSREPRYGQAQRLAAVQEQKLVDEARLGDEWPTTDQYRLLGELDFEVLALGYDQEPSDEVVRRELAARGKAEVKLFRLKPYESEKYKSSIL